MIDKSAEIRKLLTEGKTSREIARTLRVSLRDVHRVRQQEGIDFGALEREKKDREKDIISIEKKIDQMQHEQAQVENQINTLLRQKHELEAEIERKRTEVVYVKQPVEPIYFPKNYREVRKYLETLNSDQLRSISQQVLSIMNDRAISILQNAKTRIEQQTRDILKRP
jgi:chromosome segregation ATPase